MKAKIIGAISTICIVFSNAGSAATYADTVLSDNPIAYYRLDEASGNVANDSSGNERHGTYLGGVSLLATGALTSGNTAASFNGVNAYIDLPGNWGGGSAASVEAWVKPTFNTGTFESIFITPASGQYIHLQLSGGGNNVAYTNTGVVQLDNIPVEPLNAWRHLVMTVSSGTTRLFIDGDLFDTSSQTFSSINLTSDLAVGGKHFGRWFAGELDELAIYDYGLSDAQIGEHYQAAVVPLPAPFLLLGSAVAGLAFYKRKFS